MPLNQDLGDEEMNDYADDYHKKSESEPESKDEGEGDSETEEEEQPVITEEYQDITQAIEHTSY